MKITASQLRRIIKEEVAAATGMSKRVFKTPADAISYYVDNDVQWRQFGWHKMEQLAGGETPSDSDKLTFPNWSVDDYQLVLDALADWIQTRGEIADMKMKFSEKYALKKFPA